MAHSVGTLIAGKMVTNPVGVLLLAISITAFAVCYLIWDLRRLRAATSAIGTRGAKVRRIVQHLGPRGVFVALMGLACAWTTVYSAVQLIA